MTSTSTAIDDLQKNCSNHYKLSNFLLSLTFFVKPNKAGIIMRHDISHATAIMSAINFPFRFSGYVIGLVIIRYLSKKMLCHKCLSKTEVYLLALTTFDCNLRSVFNCPMSLKVPVC